MYKVFKRTWYNAKGEAQVGKKEYISSFKNYEYAQQFCDMLNTSNKEINPTGLKYEYEKDD